MWYSSFWSEGPKNHRNLKILVSKFVPRGFEARRTWGFEAQRHGVSRGGAGVSRGSAKGFRGAAPLIKDFSDLSFRAVPRGPIFFFIFITTPEGHVGVHFGDIIISIQSGTENRLIILLVLALAQLALSTLDLLFFSGSGASTLARELEPPRP